MTEERRAIKVNFEGPSLWLTCTQRPAMPADACSSCIVSVREVEGRKRIQETLYFSNEQFGSLSRSLTLEDCSPRLSIKI